MLFYVYFLQNYNLTVGKKMMEHVINSSLNGFCRNVSASIDFVDSKLSGQSPSCIIITSAAITVIAFTALEQLSIHLANKENQSANS